MQFEAEYLKGLNNEQYQAVAEKNGAVLVLAGAGSGKTKVLTSRIAQIVQDSASPYEILAVTFTNKAAKEMQSRLANYLGEDLVKKMWVGTFHNICGRILRYDLENYKTKDGRQWNNNYVIYDDSDTKTIIKNTLKKLNIDEKSFEISTVRSIISNAKNKMQDAYTFATYAKDYFNQKVSEIYYEYEKQLVLNNAIDFDDMLMLTVNLLKENPNIKEKYAMRFKHILVDEFQDTNKAQYDLIKMLYPLDGSKDKTGSLCAVGDIDQSIYSWRGADFRIILNFQSDYKNAKLIKLEQNYRSTTTILNAANEVIKNNEQRLSKNLFSTKGDGEKITLYEAEDDFGESRYIAKKIESLDCKKEDIAILYRTNAQSRSIEEALMSYSIPYKIIGGLKFYERKEIKDIISYLKLIYNHNDSQALKRIINSPKRGIGAATIEKLETLADENETGIYEIMRAILNKPDDFCSINSSTRLKLQGFYNLMEEITAKQHDYTLSEYVAYILEETGYNRELKKEDSIENQSRLENLQEFVNVANEFEEDEFNLDSNSDVGMLGNFLSQVALVSDVDEIKDEEDMQKSSVTLMTLHAAKGLEFPIVFMAGLEDGLFPHGRSINSNYSSVSNSELEEERRLMYVGITRAKEKLFLTCAKRRKVWGNFQSNPKSRFLEEIPPSLIEKDNNENSSDKINTSFQKPHNSFSNTAIKIRERKNYTNSNQTTNSNTANFASSLARIKQSAKRAQAVRKENTEMQKETINRENTNIASLIAKAKQKALTPPPSNPLLNRKSGLFPVGSRVFHPAFGVGIIKEINSSYYVVDFMKSGKRTLDTAASNLKTF